jgi:hypothetical protein|tara:strand:+ start:1003 stop:1233 length:231 start_codon:yes stop_codon:yes gene_type:complete
MKSLTIMGEKGTFKILTSTKLNELANWLGSMPEALAAFRILISMPHHCDVCSETVEVKYSHMDGEHLCTVCINNWE